MRTNSLAQRQRRNGRDSSQLCTIFGKPTPFPSGRATVRLESTRMAGHPSSREKQGHDDSSILIMVRQASRTLALESKFPNWNLVSGHDGSIIGGIDPD